MCSALSADDANLFTFKLSNKRVKNYDEVVSASTERPIARLVCLERAVDYFMRKSRITVGRSSSKRGSADLSMGLSTFISRNHLEIYTTDSKFYALVTGKNGIFVDDTFYKKGGSAFELPNSCVIRFPSTEIKIQFDVLPNENLAIETGKPYAYHDHQPAQNSITLRSNSFNDLYSSSNHSLNVVDGGLYPVSEEIISHTDAENAADIKKPAENSFESMNGSTSPQADDADALGASTTTSAAPSTTPAITTPNEHMKPPYSYAQLIVQAISSQVDRQLTLSGIYNYITKRYPFYRHGDKGWQNSIRHNLSLNRYFVKVPRAQEEAGKGCFWKIDPSSETVLMNQAFRRRRQRPVPYCKANSFDALHPNLNLSDSSTILGTDDSCASWDGTAMMTEESVDAADHHQHPQHHQHYHQHQPAIKHEPGVPAQMLAAPTLATATTSPPTASSYRCFSNTNNKTAFNALPVATNLFVTLPLGLSKSHFIFTKPLLPLPDQLTSTFVQNPPTNGCMPAQEGLLFLGNRLKNATSNNITMSTTSSATVDNGIISNNNTLKSKPLLQPYLISSQPKTIILRSNPSSQSVLPYQQSLSLASGNQFIKLSYTPPSNLSMRPTQLLNGDVGEERKVKSSLEVEQQHLHQQQQQLLLHHHQQQQLQLQQMHVINRSNNVKINVSTTESKPSILDDHPLLHEETSTTSTTKTAAAQPTGHIPDNSQSVVPAFCN